VLIAIYPTVWQFTDILINDADSFSLVLPLVVGMTITLVSVSILFKKYRRGGSRGNKSIDSELEGDDNDDSDNDDNGKQIDARQ
jgi:hypothetical protein